MTRSDRSSIAKIASNTRWAHEADRVAATRAAREGLERKFVLEVDPEGVLDPAELEKRVANAKSAYYARIARKSAAARAARAAAKRAARKTA